MSRLNEYYQRGLRSLALTHNEQNQFASGCGVEDDKGLSPQGKDLVRNAIELRMIIDLAHLSEKSFWETLDLIEYPPLVSHANAKTLCNHYRNLTDEQIKAIAGLKGVIGVNFVGRFIDAVSENITAARLADHIEYLVNLAGIDCVGLGPDFADYYQEAIMQWVRDNCLEPDLTTYPAGLEDIGGLPILRQCLEQRGFLPGEIDKIFGANFVAAYQKILS